MRIFSTILFSLITITAFSQSELKSIVDLNQEAPTVILQAHGVNSLPSGELSTNLTGESGFGFDVGIFSRPMRKQGRFLAGVGLTVTPMSRVEQRLHPPDDEVIMTTGHVYTSFFIGLKYVFKASGVFKPYLDAGWAFNDFTSVSRRSDQNTDILRISNKSRGPSFTGGFYFPLSSIINLDIQVQYNMGSRTLVGSRYETYVNSSNEVQVNLIESRTDMLVMKLGVTKAF